MPDVDPDRIEKLVTQVLEETRDFRQDTSEKLATLRRDVDKVLGETRAFRQETNEKFAAIDEKLAAVDESLATLRRDMGLVQTAVLDVAKDLKRVEAKLDKTIADHGARLDKLEGAAE